MQSNIIPTKLHTALIYTEECKWAEHIPLIFYLSQDQIETVFLDIPYFVPFPHLFLTLTLITLLLLLHVSIVLSFLVGRYNTGRAGMRERNQTM